MLTCFVAESSYLSSRKLCCRKSPNKEFIRLNLGTLLLLAFELVNVDQGKREGKQELSVGCVQVREPACWSLSENQERHLVVTPAYCHSSTLSDFNSLHIQKYFCCIFFLLVYFFSTFTPQLHTWRHVMCHSVMWSVVQWQTLPTPLGFHCGW